MINGKFNHCTRLFWAAPVTAFLLIASDVSWAGDVAWKEKSIPNWTAADARRILTDSPWAKVVTAVLTRRKNEDELRENSGNMGQPHGVGFDGVGEKQVRPKLDVPTVLTKVYTPPAAETLQLQLRWETALPVRAAELRAGELDLPTLDGEGYKIAVYGIPGAHFKGDPKSLGNPLKMAAALRREGKKDVKPSRVEVFQRQDGLVVVYLFPLSAEIGRKDTLVEFHAQIGRVVIRQSFDVHEMQFQGRLEL